MLATNTYNAYNDWGGRSLYTGGKEVSFRRPFGRGMIGRGPTPSATTARRRPRAAARSPTSTATCTRSTASPRLPRLHGLGGVVHLRAPVRRVGGTRTASSSTTRSRRDLEDRCRGRRRLRPGARRRARRVLVGRAARHRRGASCAPAATTRAFREHDVLAGPPRAAAATRWCATSTRRTTPTRSSTATATAVTGMWCDPVVGRPERRSSGPARRTACTAGSARPRRAAPARSRCTATTTGCSPAPACATATCSAPTTASSATRPSAAVSARRLQLPVAAGGDDTPADSSRRVHAVVEPGDGRVPGSIAALDDQGDLEFIADPPLRRRRRVARRVRHGNR